MYSEIKTYWRYKGSFAKNLPITRVIIRYNNDGTSEFQLPDHWLDDDMWVACDNIAFFRLKDELFETKKECIDFANSCLDGELINILEIKKSLKTISSEDTN